MTRSIAQCSCVTSEKSNAVAQLRACPRACRGMQRGASWNASARCAHMSHNISKRVRAGYSSSTLSWRGDASGRQGNGGNRLGG
eukprot:scaffold137954_cov31-Tisochrysis_lutea.AAC.1